MNKLIFSFSCIWLIHSVKAAVVPSNTTNTGLYGYDDRVEIFTKANFDSLLYGKSNRWLIEFYNSYCGFCIKYSAIFKPFAADVYFWNPVVKVGVIDCSNDANNDICRDFEILRYPTMRYFHSNYEKENRNLGEELIAGPTPDAMRTILVNKLLEEVSLGNEGWSKLATNSYSSYAEALEDVPPSTKVTFIIFDKANSTTCAEVTLDTNDYKDIVVKCVIATSKLSEQESPTHFPSLYAVRPNLSVTPLTPKNNTRSNLVYAINIYMQNNNLPLPSREVQEHPTPVPSDGPIQPSFDNSDHIFRTDLEASLRFLLTHEVPNAKNLNRDAKNAIINLLDVLLELFPFAANGKVYITELRNIISSRDAWTGAELKKIINDKEVELSPVYGSNAEWYGCKGSTAHLRGYTCGLWQLFHTLTVSAAHNNGDGPRVLQAMHGYIRNFFGCFDCQQHFLAMSEKNQLFQVNNNRKAVLWLWISHNEVNLRLAGDGSEDPQHPKVQFPTAKQCRECRDAYGGWNLEEVFAYLRSIYNPNKLKDRDGVKAAMSSGPLDSADFGLLTILYIASFLLLIIVGKMFLCKQRKKQYGWSKV